MYTLPSFDRQKIKEASASVFSNKFIIGLLILLVALASASVSFKTVSVASLQSFLQSLAQTIENNTVPNNGNGVEGPYISPISYEQAIIDSVKAASPSVVSIVISKNVPVYEQEITNPFGSNFPFEFLVPQQVQRGTEYQEVGAGSGFIVSEDGLIVTNKHVVLDETADYTIFTQEGKKYPAKVVALDPVQDLALIKISSNEKFPAAKLGDSDGIQIGQGAIVIGNALGEYSNTVSVGVVSGLGRTVSASDRTGTFSERLENIIQTDAAINSGNSGGPLINLKGEVIGVNTAMAQGAQSIGFAIPINIAKKDIDQVLVNQKITYAFLGVRYVLVTEAIQQDKNLSVDYGALVISGDDGQVAVTPGGAAHKAGVKENDIILEMDGQRITQQNTMASMIQRHNPGDNVAIKVLRDGKELELRVILGERS